MFLRSIQTRSAACQRSLSTAVALKDQSTETVAPIWLRKILKAVPYEDPWLRYPKDVHTRSPQLPNIPGGEHHKLSDNYYFRRDVKREAIPVFRIGNTENTPLQLASGEDGGGVMSVDAAGPVFVGVKRAFRREKGEHQPVIGEDVLTAFNQRYYPEQVGKDNEI